MAQIAHAIMAPVLWVVRPFVFRIGTEKGTPKVYLTSYSTLMYVWPITLVGVVNIPIIYY